MTEWRKIKGFEHYSISNKGEVKNASGHTVKPFRTNGGYLQIHLFNDGERTKKYIHRLVAETFVKNPKKLPEVNHKDGDKMNNSVDNLEWCSRTSNLIHSYYVLKNHVKPVKCIETGIIYPSTHDAERATGCYHSTISMCCDGRQKKTHSLHWGWA